MQFRPIGVEGPVEELAPERLEFGNRAGPIVAAGRGGRKRSRCEAGHDGLAVFGAAFAAWRRFVGAENEFWPDLLKEGFNCRDPPSHGDDTVFIRGEWRENSILLGPLQDGYRS
jgi:hypothetical protein